MANRAEVYTIDRDNIFEYVGIEDNINRFFCEALIIGKSSHYDFDFVFVDGSSALMIVKKY